jgi:purine nucleosidase
MRILFTFFLSFLFLVSNAQNKQKVWLDSDTGNEIDDLYAIVRLLKEPGIELIGLSSAHYVNADLLTFDKWNGYNTAELDAVGSSQVLNEEILAALGLEKITHPKGANRQIGRAWGQEDPRDSEACQAIIAAARAMPVGKKLDIVTLGALTNIASALILASDIKVKIRIYSLGAQYNTKTRVWNKNEFNIRCDLNAFDYLLNLKELDFTVMPIDVAKPLEFKKEKSLANLSDAIPVEKILENRWTEHFENSNARIMWDLALVEAYLNPAFSGKLKVQTPAENTQRHITIFSYINAPKAEADFWKTLKN